MEDEHFQQLSKKLDTIIKLLVVQTFGENKEREAIKFLSSVGYQPKDIALLIGITPNAVRIVLHRIKKAKRKIKKDESDE
jgi:hypothetical protein